MSKINVYAAGPIRGLSYDKANDWRVQLKDDLKYIANVWSPIRGKNYLAGDKKISDTYEHTLMSHSKAIYRRDKYDVLNSDVILANLLDSESISIGTMIEIGWATIETNRPRIIIIVMEESGNIHDHNFIHQSADWVVPDIDTAEEIIFNIFDNNMMC